MTARDELLKRVAGWETRCYSLAYERLDHAKRIDEIDHELAQLEGGITAARQTLNDMTIEAASIAANTKKEDTPNV